MTQKLSEQAHDQRDTDGKYIHRKILATFDQLKNEKNSGDPTHTQHKGALERV